LAVRHVPHVDQVIILNRHGSIEKSGTPNELGQAIDSLSTELGPDSKLADAEPEAPKLGLQERDAIPTSVQEGDDLSRQLGDSSMYKFYAKGVGWLSLSTFAVLMAIYAFCASFPSMFSALRVGVY
jgi:ATP-binding cassette, subfamily C (CFTR/MRP), member 1